MRLLLAALVLAFGPLDGQNEAACSDTNEIDRFASSLAKRGLQLPWRRFELSFEGSSWLEVAKWTDGATDSATVFSATATAPLSIAFTLSSESGDWVHDIEFYYRPDGSLAKRHDDLRTFYGEINAVRDAWFDCQGKELKTTRRFYFLGTKEPGTPGADFIDEPTPLYKRIEDLPFFAILLRKPMAK